jgi:ATP-binding cassette subfamily B protein
MMTMPHLPLDDILGGGLLRGRSVFLSRPSDLDEAGQPAEQWLVVTDCEVAVLAETSSADGFCWEILKSFPVAELEGCRVVPEIGCGYFQVRYKGLWIDLLRFSNPLTDGFRATAHQLDRLRSYREFLNEPTPATERESASDESPSAEDEAIPDTGLTATQSSWRALQLLRPYTRTVIILFALSLLGVGFELVPPWLQRDLVDKILVDGTPPANRDELVTALIAIVSVLAVVRCLSAVLSIIKARLASFVGSHVTAALRSRMVRKLQKLSLDYHDHNQVGMLMSRVSYDTEVLHAFVHHLTGGFGLQLVQMIAIGGMMFSINPKLALFALLPSPVVLIVTWIYCRYFYSRQNRYWDAVGRQAAALTSLLTGIRVVKSFTQEERESARFTATSEQLRDQRIRVDFATGTFSSVVGFLFAVGGLLVWYIGGRDVLQDQMSLGSLMAFLSYLAMFYAPLTTVSEAATWVSTFVAASQRIFDLLETAETPDEGAVKPDRPVQGKIEFQNVSFSYDGQQPVLEDLSFQVPQGQMIGIVGRSGSGKSTLVGLITRLYDVDRGSITIDDRDVRKYSSAELRRQVGIVLQEPFLFEGTVAANIAYGDPAAPPEKIIESAKAAAAHDFILQLPFGYETSLGEHGTGLSGGERQRISIARAILYNPRILILDEATSSVDTESERLIQSAIERFAYGRTTLAIAHRLSTLERAHRLLVLDHGRLAEQGTHAELLAADGLYARLVRMQFGEKSELAASNGDGRHAIAQPTSHSVDFEARWLMPGSTRLEAGLHGLLCLQVGNERHEGICVIRAFPASHGEEYLSLRFLAADGRNCEVGMIRRLSEWPAASQSLVRRSLNRRYLMRIIRRLESIRESHGALECFAQTDHGVAAFTVSNGHQNIKCFGDHGCLLTDTANSHYLIPDINTLTADQQQMLLSPVPAL